MTSGLVTIHVATNAAHGFVLRLLGDNLQSTAGRVVGVRPPGLHVDDADGLGRHAMDISRLRSGGIVLVDWPDPVPEGQALEFRLLLAADVDFTTSADSYITHLHFSFEPRYS